MADTANVAGPMVTGLFRNRASAERAYRSTQSLGYDAAEISVIMSDETREREFEGRATPLAQKAQEAAPESSRSAEELGGPVGGAVGTIAPVLAAVGTLLLIPGLGLAAAGPVAIALTAAGAVGVAGGLIGALTQWGVPKSRVEEYESAVRRGGILLGVKAKSKDEATKLERAWTDAGGDWIRV
jgi:hypothetical protein